MAEVSDAIANEILSPRAFSYRRMSLALATLLSAYYLLHSSLDFDQLTVFGIKARPGSGQPILVLWILWSLLIYHLIFFGVFAWRDFGVWRYNVTKRAGLTPSQQYWLCFPELRMYFNCEPSKPASRAPNTVVSDWARFAEEGTVRWRSLSQPTANRTGIGYEMPITLYKRARNKILTFVSYDCLPIYATLVAFILFWAIQR